ncbi:MAG: glycosyltransferase family A protein [Dysgonamonadaceae bacterium]
MQSIHVILPVKNSLDTTLQTIDSILNSDIQIEYDFTVYNDFSDDETTQVLTLQSINKGFNLVNLSDITNHSSPNYLLILQIAQEKAIEQNAHLLIVESDVLVKKDTLRILSDQVKDIQNPALIAAVTTDEEGEINFPYQYASKMESGIIQTQKRLSFCCTLITNSFLNAFDFKLLDPSKSWYDIFISHKAYELGFKNYLITSCKVIHKPHSSRPWKKLKYSNPLKYYWQKLIKRRDRI